MWKVTPEALHYDPRFGNVKPRPAAAIAVAGQGDRNVANVLITGAGGFLGSWVTRVFLDSGHSVRAADIAGADLSHLEQLGAEAAVCDVTRRPTVSAAVDGMDIIIHVAGLFDLAAPSQRLWAVNAEGARVIGRAAVEASVERCVLISTVGVYGRCGRDVREDGPKRPENPYERTKWAGEKFMVAECRRGGVPLAVLRPTLIYGPGGKYGLAAWLATFAVMQAKGGGKKLPIAKGGPLGHHVHVEDVARAAELLSRVNQPVEGVFNMADDSPFPGGDLIRLMAAEFGIRVGGPALPWFVGKQLPRLRGLVQRFLDGWNPKLAYHWSMLVAERGLEPELRAWVDIGWLDYMSMDHTYVNTRIKDLGFRFKHPDARVGIPEAIAWYRQQRWLPPA